CRAADAAGRRAEMAEPVAEPGGHGFRRAEGGGGARHRAGFRRAADAAGAAGRQHVCQLPRGQPRAVAADAAADGGENPERPGGGAAPVVPETGAGDRSRPSAGAGRRPRTAVGASQRGRFPRTRREARAARVPAWEQIMNYEAMLARLIAQASAEGADLATLRAIVEEASELGAGRVLGRIGLADASAGK